MPAEEGTEIGRGNADGGSYVRNRQFFCEVQPDIGQDFFADVIMLGRAQRNKGIRLYQKNNQLHQESLCGQFICQRLFLLKFRDLKKDLLCLRIRRKKKREAQLPLG